MGNGIEIAWNIYHLAFILQQNLLRPVNLMSGFRLSPLQVQVLNVLKDKKQASMKNLANEIRVSQQQLTIIAKKLVKQGIVKREYDLNDRRVIRIRPTGKGLALLDNWSREVLPTLTVKLESFREDDLIYLNAAVERLTNLINEEN